VPAPVLAEPSSPEVPVVGARSPMRRLLPVGLGALALVAIGGAVIALRDPPVQVVVVPTAQPQTPPPAPPATQTAQTPPSTPATATPNPGTPSPGTPTPPPENSGTVPAVAHPENPSEDTQPAVQKTPVPAAPSQATLLSRIQKLDRDVEARAQAGQPLSPATRKTLDGLRRKVETAGTAEERRQVARELTSWEKMFLRRK
jgi:serine/threonine-protein kinase